MTEGAETEAGEAPQPFTPPAGVLLQDLHEYLPSLDEEAEVLLASFYGTDKLDHIRTALVKAPATTCIRVNTIESGPDEVLQGLADCLKGYTHDVSQRLGQPLPPPQVHPMAPLSADTIIMASVRRQGTGGVGKASMRRGDKVVVVDRLCGEAVLRGADIFCRGIIAASSGLTDGSTVTILMDIDKRMSRGVDWALYEGSLLVIGKGISQVGRSVIFRKQRGLAVKVEELAGWQAPPLNGVMSGRMYVQNLPSIVVGHVLSPTPGSAVIDLCACPGGKTIHLAALMQNRGLLVACDRTRKKVLEMRNLCECMGATCVVPTVMDSTQAVLRAPHEQWGLPKPSPEAVITAAEADQDGLKPIKGFFPETFDFVLLDPPCSALGLRPRFKIEATAAELRKHAAYQRNLLWAAAWLLRPGGTLVYSTCTFNPLENEFMVKHALDAFPCLKLVPAEPRLGRPGLTGTGLSPPDLELVQRYDPSDDKLDTMGFFIAKFVKVSSIADERVDMTMCRNKGTS